MGWSERYLVIPGWCSHVGWIVERLSQPANRWELPASAVCGTYSQWCAAQLDGIHRFSIGTPMTLTSYRGPATSLMHQGLRGLWRTSRNSEMSHPAESNTRRRTHESLLCLQGIRRDLAMHRAVRGGKVPRSTGETAV